MHDRDNSFYIQGIKKEGKKKCMPQELVIERVELAHAYVPFQKFCGTCSPEEGLRMGTIFLELYSPYGSPVHVKSGIIKER